MAMTMTHVHQLLDVREKSDERPLVPELPMWMGVGAVDPKLIEPRDGQTDQQVEELIAFRCSCL